MEIESFLNTTKTIEISNKSIDYLLNKNLIFDSINCFFIIIFCISSVILNLQLILNWIFVCKKDNYADFLIISMATADFIEGFIVGPFLLTRKLSDMRMFGSFESETLTYLIDSIDSAIYLISPSLLFLLSLHRLKQLISPFKDGVKLNRLRIAAIVSIWLFIPIMYFIINWYNMIIKYERSIDMFYHISLSMIILSILVVNILITVKFKSKLKNKRFKKNNFKKEKKAIICTLSLSLILLITMGPYLILHPFAIFKYEFVESIHGIYNSIAYCYIIIDPLILIFFYKKFRINFKLISNKLQSNPLISNSVISNTRV